MRRTLATLAVALGAGAAVGETPVERGAYLVEAVMACGACHSPRGPDAEARRFSGGPRAVETAAYVVHAGNITPDVATGLGAWTDAEIRAAIAQGVGRDGRRLAPEMPSAFYRALTPADLDAVVAYLRSLPAVANATPAPVYRAPFESEVWPEADPAPAPTDAVARGRYLMNAAYCMSCHGRGADGRLDPAAPGRGGHAMTGPWGEKRVSDVTADPEAGVGAWTDAELDRALAEGVGRDGQAFIAPMARGRFYGRMTPADRADVVAALRALAPSR